MRLSPPVRSYTVHTTLMLRCFKTAGFLPVEARVPFRFWYIGCDVKPAGAKIKLQAHCSFQKIRFRNIPENCKIWITMVRDFRPSASVPTLFWTRHLGQLPSLRTRVNSAANARPYDIIPHDMAWLKSVSYPAASYRIASYHLIQHHDRSKSAHIIHSYDIACACVNIHMILYMYVSTMEHYIMQNSIMKCRII